MERFGTFYGDMENLWGASVSDAIEGTDGQVEPMKTFASFGGRHRGPTQRLADAVLTQAFRDLKTLSGSSNEGIARTWESAKAFLLGETPEGRRARTTFCDVLDMDPAFIERMANAVIELENEQRARQRNGRRASKQSKRSKIVA